MSQRGESMSLSYKKLWKLLIDRNMKKKDLRELSGISSASMAKLGKNENVTTEVLVKICTALKCDISDIMEIEEDQFDYIDIQKVKVFTLYSSIELFSGTGGLALGLQQSGFDHRALLEWDKDSCDNIKSNIERGYPLVQHWNVIQTDVRLVHYDDFGRFSTSEKEK